MFDSALAADLGKLIVRAYDMYKGCPLGTIPPFKKVFDLTIDEALVGSGDYQHFGFIAESDTHLIAVMRGTETLLEWVHDLEIELIAPPTVRVRGNIERGLSSMYPSLQVEVGDSPHLSSFLLGWARLKQKKIIIAGHSLGGAMAKLVAADIVECGGNVDSVYTFATPRIGDETFTKDYNAKVPNTWRIVNNHDIIPNLPPYALGYADSGKLFMVELGCKVKPTLRAWHSIEAYVNALDPSFPLGPSER